MATMYYSSESSDSEMTVESSSLDLSYLMLDSDALAQHLRNSVREQRRYNPAHTSQPCDTVGQAMEGMALEDGVEGEGGMEGEGGGTRARDDTHTTSSRRRLESCSEDEESTTTLDTVTEKLLLQHNLLLTLPFDVVRFSRLRMLDLSNNNLSHLNDFLLQLPELQSLYVRNNGLGDDALPKDLPQLTRLREINLSGNELRTFPTQLYAMPGLRYVYLGNNKITQVLPDVREMASLEVLHLGGNLLETVPDELGELQQLGALVLCDNRLRKLPRSISNLTRLRSLLLHKNNLCCLPVGVVKLRSLTELSIRDNPLVSRFVQCCAKNLMYTPPSLLELAARTIKLRRVPYTRQDLPHTLIGYLSSGQRCVNPKCKGMFFTSCVEHIKFVDFCGMYRVPLVHYLCSSRCSTKTPTYYRAASSESESEEDYLPSARMKRVLLG